LRLLHKLSRQDGAAEPATPTREILLIESLQNIPREVSAAITD